MKVTKKKELLQVNFDKSDIIFYPIGYPKMVYDCTQRLHLFFKTHLRM